MLKIGMINIENRNGHHCPQVCPPLPREGLGVGPSKAGGGLPQSRAWAPYFIKSGGQSSGLLPQSTLGLAPIVNSNRPSLVSISYVR